MQVVVCERGRGAALPGNCTAECGLRQCCSSSLCPHWSLQTHQLLFYAPKHTIWCQQTFLSGTRSLREALTKWGVSGALSIKPHPEAKLCFYCVDTSKHVLPPPPTARVVICSHFFTSAALFTVGLCVWFTVLSDAEFPMLPWSPKAMQFVLSRLKLHLEAADQLSGNAIFSTIFSASRLWSSSCKRW